MGGDHEPGEVLLEAERVRVEFGALAAVRDVSLMLHGRHLLGLIGPNGAGKTTLLRALAGLQPLAAGRVKVLGNAVGAGETHAMRQIGFTPDNPPVYEELTVRQFLQFIALGYGLERAEAHERIGFWIEQVWLSDKLDQKIKTLSRGMRQRLGLARTLLSNPAVILLDEPAAGLDPAGRVQFRRLLTTLREQGKAIVVSSHILADMNEYCTHIAIMARGEFLRYGTVDQIARSSDGTRRRYTVGLAAPVDAVRGILARIPGVELIEANHEQMIVEYGREPQQAAELLALLVEYKLPVASFYPQAPGLEEAYLQAGIRQVD